MKNESTNVIEAIQTAPAAAATPAKKVRKAREAKLTIENAGKACGIKPEVTQNVVAHALVFFHANYLPMTQADKVKAARARNIAESFRVMSEVSLMTIGDTDEAEEAKASAELQRAFGVSVAVKPAHA